MKSQSHVNHWLLGEPFHVHILNDACLRTQVNGVDIAFGFHDHFTDTIGHFHHLYIHAVAPIILKLLFGIADIGERNECTFGPMTTQLIATFDISHRCNLRSFHANAHTDKRLIAGIGYVTIELSLLSHALLWNKKEAQQCEKTQYCKVFHAVSDLSFAFNPLFCLGYNPINNARSRGR